MSTLRVFDWASIFDEARRYLCVAFDRTRSDVAETLAACLMEWDQSLDDATKVGKTDRLLLVGVRQLEDFAVDGNIAKEFTNWLSKQNVKLLVTSEETTADFVVRTAVESTKPKIIQVLSCNKTLISEVTQMISDEGPDISVWDLSVNDGEVVHSAAQPTSNVYIGGIEKIGSLLGIEDFNVVDDKRREIQEKALQFLRDQLEDQQEDSDDYSLYENWIIDAVGGHLACNKAVWTSDDVLSWLKKQEEWKLLDLKAMPTMFKKAKVVERLRSNRRHVDRRAETTITGRRETLAIEGSPSGDQLRTSLPGDTSDITRHIGVLREWLGTDELAISRREVWGPVLLSCTLLLQHLNSSPNTIKRYLKEPDSTDQQVLPVDLVRLYKDISLVASELADPEVQGIGRIAKQVIFALLGSRRDDPDTLLNEKHLEQLVESWQKEVSQAEKKLLLTESPRYLATIIAKNLDGTTSDHEQLRNSLTWLTAETLSEIEVFSMDNWTERITAAKSRQARDVLMSLSIRVPSTVSVWMWEGIMESLYTMVKDFDLSTLNHYSVRDADGQERTNVSKVFDEVAAVFQSKNVGSERPSKTTIRFLLSPCLKSYVTGGAGAIGINAFESFIRDSKTISEANWKSYLVQRAAIGFAVQYGQKDALDATKLEDTPVLANGSSITFLQAAQDYFGVSIQP